MINDATASARENEIVRAATRTLRKAVDAEPPERTRLLREVADLLIDLRGIHTGTDGLPDWRGKSYAYRDAVRDIYSGAGLDREGSDTTKTALRYHVGVALRDRLTEDDLKAAGLSLLDPRDRQASRRAAHDESTPPTVDKVIANLALLARRLDEMGVGAVSAYDRARVEEARRRIDRWLKAHRSQSK